jgi:hypothetical protein
MPIPTGGGGYQVGDGSSSVQLYAMPAPATATATATLTAAQLAPQFIVGNPSTSAASYTLPTVAALEALIPNAEKVGLAFDVVVQNLGTSAGVITLVTNTGWTLSGNMAVAITSSARFTARKTGAGAWTLYRAA